MRVSYSVRARARAQYFNGQGDTDLEYSCQRTFIRLFTLWLMREAGHRAQGDAGPSFAKKSALMAISILGPAVRLWL
jgi:hypothetical protein